MKNFEKYEAAVRNVTIAGIMIDKTDPKQQVYFCSDWRCRKCIFNPKNYKAKYGIAQSGCYRNKIDWLYREEE